MNVLFQITYVERFGTTRIGPVSVIAISSGSYINNPQNIVPHFVFMAGLNFGSIPCSLAELYTPLTEALK